MATQDQSGLKSELQEPVRTEENTGFGTPQQETGDYGGLSNQQAPHHKTHTDDELLPKPTADEQALPSGTGTGYGDQTTAEPKGLIDETPGTEPQSFGETKSEGYADPSGAFAGAPVDRKIEKPGYGHDVETSEPVSTTAAPESPSPKKEGLLQKLKNKLPGHHKTSTPETVEHTSPTGTSEPKKGLVTKIKEKLPGHHPTTTTTTTTTPTSTTPTTTTPTTPIPVTE